MIDLVADGRPTRVVSDAGKVEASLASGTLRKKTLSSGRTGVTESVLSSDRVAREDCHHGSS